MNVNLSFYGSEMCGATGECGHHRDTGYYEEL